MSIIANLISPSENYNLIMSIAGQQGHEMSYTRLNITRRFQQILDIPDANVCFSVNEFLEKLKIAKKKERFTLLEGFI